MPFAPSMPLRGKMGAVQGSLSADSPSSVATRAEPRASDVSTLTRPGAPFDGSHASPLNPGASCPIWLAWLAGGLPLAFYVATATAHGGLFDEGALIAAAQSLGVAHPPGGLLTTLWSALFTELPIGPLSFRVSISAAVCAAGLLAMFARSVYFTLVGAGIRDVRRAAPLALAAAWCVGQAPMFWLQATRPNLYALQFLLSMVMVEALLRFELSEPTEDTRLLYFAAFVQGLTFANHHVYALWMLSAAAPTLGRVFARRGFVGMMGHVAFPILGFSASAYLPIRASQHSAISFGDPETLGNLYWCMNEDPWWGPAYAMPHSTTVDLAHGLNGAMVWPFALLVVLAAVAFWFSLTVRAFRRFALLWMLVFAVPFGSVALLIKPQLTVDAWGSLLPCALGLVALATAAVGLLLERFWGAAGSLEAPRRAPALALAGLALLGFLGGPSQTLSAFVQPDSIDELARRALPSRAMVLSYDGGTVFRHLGAEAEEQLRADVVMVPLSFLHFPGLLDELVDQHPELRALLAEHVMTKKLSLDKLQSLSAVRPVLLELAEDVPANLYGTLVPDAWYQRVLPDGATLADAQSAGSLHLAAMLRFFPDASQTRLLLPSALAEQVDLKLGRMHFFHGLLSAALADLPSARQSVAQGKLALPEDPALNQLASEMPDKGRLPPERVLGTLREKAE
jgi:hypothetical protein